MNAAIQKYNTLGWPLPMCNSTLGSSSDGSKMKKNFPFQSDKILILIPIKRKKIYYLSNLASSSDLSELISKMLPNVAHKEVQKGLDGLLTPDFGYEIRSQF